MEREFIYKDKESKSFFERDFAFFHSKTKINVEGTKFNIEGTNVKKILKEMINEILNTISIYQKNGSGWYFKEVIRLEIHIVDYKPLKGETYIPLPEFLQKKKAIINLQNKDNKCFLWSILRYLNPVQKNAVRLRDLKKYENDLNFNHINFPVRVKDITKFEKQNPNLPGINVFSLNENNKICPLRTNKKDFVKSLDLFLYSKDGKQHYSLIKNFSRLIRSQITKDTTKQIFVCKRCLNYHTKEELLEKHLTYCKNNETALIRMPTKKNNIIKFKNHFKKLPLPFVIYADFECFTVPINTCQPNPEKSFTQIYQKHEPNSFCLYLKALDGMKTNFKPILYTKKTPDEDVSEKFIECVVELTHKLYEDYYQKPKPLVLTKEEEKGFQSATICHICEEKLSSDKKTKVRDHCHFTGKYRGAAHNKCNLECRKPLILPVIFHNLQGYDAHLFIKKTGKSTRRSFLYSYN